MIRPVFPAVHRTAAALTSAGALAAGLTAAPVVADAQPVGGTGFAPGSAVAAVVTVPKPWYAPRALVASRMRDTIPQYDAIPGLAFKAYSFAQADGQFGGVYLWKDEASARQWVSDAWKGRVRATYGSDATIEWFDVPILLPTRLAGRRAAWAAGSARRTTRSSHPSRRSRGPDPSTRRRPTAGPRPRPSTGRRRRTARRPARTSRP